MDIINCMSLDIEGFIELIVEDMVYGWVNVDPMHFSLSVTLDGIIIGTAEDFLPRVDLITKPLAKGFAIKCNQGVTLADLIGGKLQVIAINTRSIAPLPVWPPLREAGVFLNIDVAELKKAWNSVPVTFKKAFVAELEISQAGRGFGRISSDGVAQVGRNDYLFLVSGSNHLSKFYTGEIEVDVDHWVTCFARRHEQLRTLGIRYVQVMIPEKSSTYYEYAPYAATPGSAAYLELIRMSKEQNIPLCDALPDLLSAKEHKLVYLQGDTHLNTFGAEIVAGVILKFLGEAVSYDPPTIVKRLRVGDLSERFADDGDIQELVTMFETLRFNGVSGNIELLSSFDPDTGNQGRRRIWRNDLAPIKKKVVCFGGSSFETGEVSGNLSWWFARLFSEFHFIWSPNVDFNYVESVLPDIVVCQTIERFLTEVPEH